ncbi:hypothetical protein [Demequina sp. NBRC 110054]|uniref:hypothetical protein n=1 Tax=Demequina sp. NBRC 110054 TaxID=1570343 RepID=UPI000A03B3D7|nr:hypothetical protein [Demequina sp. NBRC 110054]
MTATATAVYTIRLDGHLGDHWAWRLGGLDLRREPDGTTTLSGAVSDQSHLHAVLAAVRDIGATLLEVRREPQ